MKRIRFVSRIANIVGIAQLTFPTSQTRGKKNKKEAEATMMSH